MSEVEQKFYDKHVERTKQRIIRAQQDGRTLEEKANDNTKIDPIVINTEEE